MVFEEIIDRVIKARADVLHADKILAQWDLRAGECPDANEYSLLVTLIKHANEILDSVVTGMVKASSETASASQPVHSRLGSRQNMNRSRSF